MTGKLRPVNAGPPQWTKIFGEALTQLAAEYPRLVAITAAMPSGTGITVLPEEVARPLLRRGDRRGARGHVRGRPRDPGHPPVVAIYSTFLQRAYDSIIHDVAIQRLPVIFAIDRAGMVGEDGQTHMGLYDIPYLLAVPHMTVTAPKDGDGADRAAALRARAQDGPFSRALSARQGPRRCAARRRSGSGPLRHVGSPAQGKGLRAARGRRHVPGRARGGGVARRRRAVGDAW